MQPAEGLCGEGEVRDKMQGAGANSGGGGETGLCILHFVPTPTIIILFHGPELTQASASMKTTVRGTVCIGSRT